jgi:hypothetical protein
MLLLLQMMYPVSEIWRPVAFEAPPPHPLLLQPLPCVRLLRTEDVTMPAAGGVAPGVCSAAGGDSSSCPAPSQSRCPEPVTTRLELLMQPMSTTAEASRGLLCTTGASFEAPCQVPLASRDSTPCPSVAGRCFFRRCGCMQTRKHGSLYHGSLLQLHLVTDLHPQPAPAPGDDGGAPQLGGAERHRPPAGLELHPPAAHRASAGAAQPSALPFSSIELQRCMP